MQFYLFLRFGFAKGRGIAGGLIAYFGYFTVLTNILATVALTVGAFANPAVVGTRAKLATFFSRPNVNTAIAASIALVAVTYFLLLRHTWNPTGLQLLTDVLLHDVMPVLFLVYWWLVAPKRGLRWFDAARWALYPVGYLAYALGLGALTGRYPYPFIDVGYLRVLLNSAVLLIAFAAIALLLIAVGRLSDRATVSLHQKL